jgi:hypothetical protein
VVTRRDPGGAGARQGRARHLLERAGFLEQVVAPGVTSSFSAASCANAARFMITTRSSPPTVNSVGARKPERRPGQVGGPPETTADTAGCCAAPRGAAAPVAGAGQADPQPRVAGARAGNPLR